MHVAPWLPVGTREIYISSSSATPPCSVAFMFDIRSSRLQRPSVKLLTLDPCAAQMKLELQMPCEPYCEIQHIAASLSLQRIHSVLNIFM